jgi:hypothetical protein
MVGESGVSGVRRGQAESARLHRRQYYVVALAALLIGVSVAHVLEDFVYGIPARFGFQVAPAAALVGLAYAGHVVLVALAAQDRTVGYLGNLAVGIFWFAAAAYDHLGEVLAAASYRAGSISKAFEVGLMLSAIALAVISLVAWRSRRRVMGKSEVLNGRQGYDTAQS